MPPAPSKRLDLQPLTVEYADRVKFPASWSSGDTRSGRHNIYAIGSARQIACLLIHLWTGGKPTLRTFEMPCLYLRGWATLDEVVAHLEKLKAKSREPPAGG